MTSLLLFTILLTFSQAASAQHLSILGGGGEPAGEGTIFDHWIDLTSKYAKDSKSKLTVSFDGGHPKTEKALQKFYPSAKNSAFTGSSFEKIITDYEKKIESGAIKRGEQILLMMNNHGAQKEPEGQTHKVCTSESESQIVDYNSGKGCIFVSMDALKRLADLAEKRNVKLGIVDMSCHSGLSLALKNSKTCVISAAGPEQFGFAGTSEVFSNALSRAMKPGRTLEDAFLEARKNATDVAFPMISSPGFEALQKDLYDRMGRYMNYKSGKSDKTIDDLKSILIEDRCEVENQSFQKLLEILGTLQKVTNAPYDDLMTSLQQYHNFRNDFIRKLETAGAKVMGEKKDFCTPIEDGKGQQWCVEYTAGQLVNIDFDKLIAEKEKESPQKRDDIAFKAAWLSVVRKAQTWKNDLILKGINLERLKNLSALTPDYESKTQELAQNVADQSRKLYDDLYKLKKKDPAPNPCREFKL